MSVVSNCIQFTNNLPWIILWFFSILSSDFLLLTNIKIMYFNFELLLSDISHDLFIFKNVDFRKKYLFLDTYLVFYLIEHLNLDVYLVSEILMYFKDLLEKRCLLNISILDAMKQVKKSNHTNLLFQFYPNIAKNLFIYIGKQLQNYNRFNDVSNS